MRRRPWLAAWLLSIGLHLWLLAQFPYPTGIHTRQAGTRTLSVQIQRRSTRPDPASLSRDAPISAALTRPAVLHPFPPTTERNLATGQIGLDEQPSDDTSVPGRADGSQPTASESSPSPSDRMRDVLDYLHSRELARSIRQEQSFARNSLQAPLPRFPKHRPAGSWKPPHLQLKWRSFRWRMGAPVSRCPDCSVSLSATRSWMRIVMIPPTTTSGSTWLVRE